MDEVQDLCKCGRALEEGNCVGCQQPSEACACEPVGATEAAPEAAAEQAAE
jgi:hypothetical protein